MDLDMVSSFSLAILSRDALGVSFHDVSRGLVGLSFQVSALLITSRSERERLSRRELDLTGGVGSPISDTSLLPLGSSEYLTGPCSAYVTGPGVAWGL